MKGIIIAGGLGTRLRPLTYRRPKPLVPVANRPFLEYQVVLLREHGVKDIVFATNYMAEMIEGHFGDGSRFGVRMQYALEETPLGTGGAIRNAADLFPGDTVVVFNGDVLTDFDLGAVVRFHEERNADATITLAPIPVPHPFGVLRLDAEGRVLEWREPTEEAKRAVEAGHKPDGEQTDLINAGFYVLSPEAVARIPQGVKSSIERDIYPPLIADGRVYGIAPGGFWMDVGRPAQLMEATQAVLTEKVKTSLPTIAVGEGAVIAPAASVDRLTAVGPGCTIEDGALVTGSILLAGATVGKGAIISNVIVDEGSRIEPHTVIEAPAREVRVLSNEDLSA